MSEYRQSTAPFWLDIRQPELFPEVSLALQEPDGLLAIGGDLSEKRILAAYRQGIFPWYSDDQPILWWSPDPRMVLYPDNLHISKSLQKKIRKRNYSITFDQAFDQVINECAAPRAYTEDTWITDKMKQAYIRLHKNGHAHSVECWQNEELIGGLYGVAIGKVFFGESMFSKRTDASKIAFVYLTRQLQRWGYQLIDCQVYSEHLSSLGAGNISRNEFIKQIQQMCKHGVNNKWQCNITSSDILPGSMHE